MARKRKIVTGSALLTALVLVMAACSDDSTTEPAGSGTGTAGGEGSIWVLLPDTESSTRWEEDDFVVLHRELRGRRSRPRARTSRS